MRSRRFLIYLKTVLLFCATCLLFWVYYAGELAKSHTHIRITKNRADMEVSNSESQDAALKVIIVSYMRSGSSALGQLFDTNDDVLYVFEPVWYLCEMAAPSYTPLLYFNGTRGYPPTSCGDIGAEIAESYLTCDINNIDTGSLSQVWMKNGRKTNEFLRCGLRLTCTDNFIKVCRSSPVRVIKTIRLSLEEIKPLLAKFSNLKVIHLVRDPRGLMHSRMKIHEYYYRNPRITSMKVCGDMLRDSGTFKQLHVMFPGRVLQIRYEDFADDPQRYSKIIYDFLNLLIPESTKQWIVDNMQAVADDDHHGTARANSSKTSYNWRRQISWSLVKNMEKDCDPVYSEYLYTAAKSEKMLRNLDVSLRLEVCKNNKSVTVCIVKSRNQNSVG